ncbi:MAG: EamA family transporter, partial [Ilumatobacteraceae bacterium]
VPLDPIASLAGELIVLFVPALGLIVLGFVRADGIPHVVTSFEWVFLAGTGAITAVPLLLFAFAAQRVPFTLLGPTNYLVPVINFLLGWLIFDESLPAIRLVGFGLVWVALALVTVDLVRGRDPAPACTPVPVR